MQNQQPIAFGIKALADTEMEHAQIEEELLAVLFQIEWFHLFLFGPGGGTIWSHAIRRHHEEGTAEFSQVTTMCTVKTLVQWGKDKILPRKDPTGGR